MAPGLAQRRQHLAGGHGAPEHLHVGVAKTVDRLLGIAHHLDLHAARLEQFEKLALQRVHILKFVHQHHPVAACQAPHSYRGTGHQQRLPLHLTGRQQRRPEAHLEPLVGRLEQRHQRPADLRVVGDEPFAERALLKEPHGQLHRPPAEQLTGGVKAVLGALREQQQAAQLFLEHRPGLPLAEAAQVGIETHRWGHQGQAGAHEPMDGRQGGPLEFAQRLLESRALGLSEPVTDLEVAALAKQLTHGVPNALPQLRRSGTGEGHPRNSAQRGACADQLEVAQH